MEVLYTSPWIVGCILVIPVVIIGLAKSWKRLKDKKAEKAAGTTTTPS